MEIKKGTLVAVIKDGWAKISPVAIVMRLEERSSSSKFIIKGLGGGHLRENKENMFPLAENCDIDTLGTSVTDELNKKLPEIIRNFADMANNSKQEIEELKRKLTSVQELLKETRVSLTNHAVNPHSV